MLNILKKYSNTIFLAIIVVALLWFEVDEQDVEQYYYGGIYPHISNVQRKLFGWLPFSIGDIIYVFVVVKIIWKLISLIIKLREKATRYTVLHHAFIKAINYILTLFIVFKLLWGLNYSRQGIAEQMQLQKEIYCKEELIPLLEDLIFEANAYRQQIKDTSLPHLNTDTIFQQTEDAYAIIKTTYPFLKIQNYSLKPSVFSPMGNYLGYTGYYNPFTGEAQVRTDIPKILLPFITCHEVAHQLGYASEDEANFVSYIVCKNSNNIYFKYSMCLEIIDYIFNDVMLKYVEDLDIKAGINKRLQLEDCFSPQVRKDRKAIRDFFFKNKKEVSNFSAVLYDKYLKLNSQLSGINSYNEVVGLILALRAKQ